MAPDRQLLLGLDVGTTATKAALFDLCGATVAVATRPHTLITPRPGWVEQDPDELWQAVVDAIRAVLSQQAPGDRVVALSIASQGGTTIPVNEKGVPVYAAISWMDERASRQAEHIRQVFGDEFVYRTTGWHLGNTLPLQHLGWLRDERPEVLELTARVLFVNDFILQQLTGDAVMNPSDATMTQLFNIAAGDWETCLLDEVELRRDQLSAIAPSGHALGLPVAEAIQATGLPPDTLVVNGAHDQYCAAVATGVTRPGTVLLSSGTAWVILAVPQDLTTGLASGMAVSCHAVPGRWGAIVSLGGVGASLEWLLKTLRPAAEEPVDVNAGAASLNYAALNAAAVRSGPGARGLLFYPLAGGHSRIGAGHGGFLQLALEHTYGDMVRAIMEGTCFELRWVLEGIRARGLPVSRLTLVGGAATSPLWPQIIADVASVPVALPADRQAAARGAAILAGVGAGIFPDMESGFEMFQVRETLLHPGNATPYEAAFARYQTYYHRVYAPEGDTSQ
jgi:xylulokinase